MKAFISPVYIQTNSVSSEKIVLGLIAVADEKIFFNTSKHKLEVAAKLLGNPVKSVLETSVQMIQNKIKEITVSKNFSEEYFNYLSKYSNGLIQFGTPKPVATEINKTTFEELFKIFVGETIDKEKATEKTFQSKVKDKLSVPGVIEKADVNYTIKPIILPGLLKPTVVSLLTTNGSIQALQAIDFEATETSITNNLYEFEILTKLLDKISNKYLNSPGVYKVVAKEPALNTPQHDLFEKTIKFKKESFEILEEGELANETSNIIHAPHHKFSTFIETL
jgi:hypothetical protein